MVKRYAIRVAGRVQGVGFRPTVYRHAVASGVSGFVRNTPSGVEVEAEGESAALDLFLQRLREEPPPQAVIEAMTVREMPPVNEQDGFRIIPSEGSGDLLVGLPPDLALCADCARELADPADRRHRHPFINCTNCGPRFTIAESLPYDRARTTMRVFDMCPDCRSEYENPGDRRFDAQPVACPKCGPTLRFLDASGQEIQTTDPLSEAARRLREGQILAVKGVGGYHLCCDAHNENALRLLRERKARPAKPLAVMFSSIEEIRRELILGEDEARALASPAAPAVVLRRRPGCTLARLLSPDTDDVGALLPYTPLHRLLLEAIHPLVMTSGNLAEEPIIKDESELGLFLGRIADGVLSHDRAIVRRCDDSVIRFAADGRVLLRRSRGWTPGHVPLPLEGPPVLACGAEVKSTFCVTRGREAILSQHIGDLSEYPSVTFYREALADLLGLLRIRPEIVAHDLHPDYASTRFALDYPAARRVAVQHHHAHIAACMAEHSLTGPVLGVALDGSGYGPDGMVWGGEFLVADYAGYRRAGHFKPYRLPGGEGAIRHPSRMAFSVLAAELGAEAERVAAEQWPAWTAEQRASLMRLIESGAHSPWTSSAGRLFDAASALLGLCDEISYEGQAAVRLETAADRDERGAYPSTLIEKNDCLQLDFGATWRTMLEDRRRGLALGRLAARFHRGVAEGVAAMSRALREREGLNRVALSGGVFQNALLLEWLLEVLKKDSFEVYSHHQVPPNDGGLSLGQAVVALAVEKAT